MRDDRLRHPELVSGSQTGDAETAWLLAFNGSVLDACNGFAILPSSSALSSQSANSA